MPAECEVPLGNGRPCGVAAIGRCDVDGRAFCATHQTKAELRGPGWGWFALDRCTPCDRAMLQAARDRNAEQEAIRKKHFSFTYLTEVAPQELEAARVPPVEIVRVYRTQGRGLFGRPSRSASYEQHVETVATGWLLGNLRWGYNDGGNYGGIDLEADTLTALVPVDRWVNPDDIPRGMPNSGALHRVIKTARGYELGPGSSYSVPKWEWASLAVHKITSGTESAMSLAHAAGIDDAHVICNRL